MRFAYLEGCRGRIIAQGFLSGVVPDRRLVIRFWQCCFCPRVITEDADGVGVELFLLPLAKLTHDKRRTWLRSRQGSR